MKSKKYVVGIIVTILALIFIVYNLSFIAPKVYITSKIINVNEKDYKLFVENSKIPSKDKTRNNCRYIYVKVNVVTPLFLIRNLKIERDTLEGFLYYPSSKVQFLGRYYSDGRKGYFDGIDVYLNGTSETGLKDVFKDYKIEVSWVGFLNGHKKQTYYLKDYLK